MRLRVGTLTLQLRPPSFHGGKDAPGGTGVGTSRSHGFTAKGGLGWVYVRRGWRRTGVTTKSRSYPEQATSGPRSVSSSDCLDSKRSRVTLGTLLSVRSLEHYPNSVVDLDEIFIRPMYTSHVESRSPRTYPGRKSPGKVQFCGLLSKYLPSSRITTSGDQRRLMLTHWNPFSEFKTLEL